MPSDLHEQFCQKAVSWLKRRVFVVSAIHCYASNV